MQKSFTFSSSESNRSGLPLTSLHSCVCFLCMPFNDCICYLTKLSRPESQTPSSALVHFFGVLGMCGRAGL
ncbi:hypothetical protein I3760_03G084800 [Carya illinoinensis]|nr:hypothetical protein I3760_03G084800 [Carya illinoinensis]